MRTRSRAVGIRRPATNSATSRAFKSARTSYLNSNARSSAAARMRNTRVPAERLDELNRAIVGKIVVIGRFTEADRLAQEQAAQCRKISRPSRRRRRQADFERAVAFDSGGAGACGDGAERLGEVDAVLYARRARRLSGDRRRHRLQGREHRRLPRRSAPQRASSWRCNTRSRFRASRR